MQYLSMRITGARVENGTSHREICLARRSLKNVPVLLVVRIVYKMEVGGRKPEGLAFALSECSHGPHSIDIMDADFFDDTLLVIAFRSQEDGMSLRQSDCAKS